MFGSTLGLPTHSVERTVDSDGTITDKHTPLSPIQSFGNLLTGAVVPHHQLMTSDPGIIPGVHFTPYTGELTPMHHQLLTSYNSITTLHPSPRWAMHLGSGSVMINGHFVDTGAVIHPSALVNPPTILDGGAYHTVTMSSITPHCPTPNAYSNMHYSVSTKPMTYSPPCPGLPMHKFILSGHTQQDIGSTVTGLGCFTPTNTLGHKINLTIAEGNACGVNKVTMHEVMNHKHSNSDRHKYHHTWHFLQGYHPYSPAWVRHEARRHVGGGVDQLGGGADQLGGGADQSGGQVINYYTTAYNVDIVDVTDA